MQNLFDADNSNSNPVIAAGLRMLADYKDDYATNGDYAGSAGSAGSTYDDSKADVGYGEVKIDYTVMAIMVFTLGLILVVELSRHYIDHKAESRPFAQSVLTSVYSELSTLGIVEAAVYVLLSYYDGLNMDQKKVFEYCHFLLFFTAIFNALQSCFQAFFSFRVCNRLWIRTEQVELSHYVAIREEFEFLERKVNRLKPPSVSSPSLCRRLWRIIVRCYVECTNPYTFRQYRRLLVQVKYHELRVHFLQANSLPLTIKLSDYLAASNLFVLKSIVSVSAFAWILLVGASNITYFLMGMLVHVSDDGESVSKAMAYLFVGGNAFAVTLSLVLLFKMKFIFAQIMKMKFIDVAVTTVRFNQEVYTDMKEQQLAMFWGSNPGYVIGVIQFMQFGYAISAGILIIFWEKIDQYAFIPATHYLISILVSYAIFVLVLAEVIPRYAMCTSLGALVNRKRLREITSLAKLDEAVTTANTAPEAMTDGGDDATSVRSDESSLHSKLSNISELVKTKTQDLRSTRSIRNLGNIDDPAEIKRERKARRKKSYSDSPSVAMMQHYGSNSLGRKSDIIPETDAVESVGMSDDGDTVSVLESTSYLDLQMLGDQKQHSTNRSVQFQIEGTPDDVVPPPVQRPVGVKAPPAVEEEDEVQPRSRSTKFLDFVETANYRLISFVFGTMACFYFVGMRVEALLIADGEFKDHNATFQFPLDMSFWFEVAWLLAMLTVSAFLFKISGPERRKIRLACCIDAVILLACLGFLFGAEMQRCCDDFDCCGPWGTRTNGGIGKIEPFTSLVIFRVLRYYIAKKFLKYFDKDYSDRKKASKDAKPGGHGHGHGPGMLHEKGNIVDLWTHAVSAYPEVVQKEGEFSSALLMAMLGITGENAHNVPGSSKATLAAAPRAVPSVVKAKSATAAPSGHSARILSPGGGAHDKARLDARTILPMRRCDWMLPPLIDHWRAVDVVATEKEVVILQAIDVEAANKGMDDNDLKFLKHYRKTINTTKGGVGMKLREVIAGRKILGRVDMSLIDAVSIERLPRERLPSLYKKAHGDDEDDFIGDEFWSEEGISSPGDGVQSRMARWTSVCEDQLKIHTSETTTYLRFYSDLEAKTKEGNLSVSLVQSFQWCRTIAHLRGPNNLEQKLPHFGEENDSELLDYLHVTSRASGGAEHHGRATKFEGFMKHLHLPHHGHHRSSSNGGNDKTLRRQGSSTAGGNSKTLRRQGSNSAGHDAV